MQKTYSPLNTPYMALNMSRFKLNSTTGSKKTNHIKLAGNAMAPKH